MADRRLGSSDEVRLHLDAARLGRVGERTVVGATQEIADAKQLLDSGAISHARIQHTQAEGPRVGAVRPVEAGVRANGAWLGVSREANI